MSDELKPCPCGKTPNRLGISDGNQGGKYHFVAGDCCAEWMIEFRANYKPIESDECMALAVAAWNASPRAALAAREPAAQSAAVPDGFAVLNVSELRNLTFSFNGRERLEAMLAAAKDGKPS